MAINLRYVFYKTRANEKWKGVYEEKVQGSISNTVYNDYSIPNIRSANPIRHWRKQYSSSGVNSRLNLLSEINKPGNVTTSTKNRCPSKTSLQLDYRLSKNTGCCSYEQKKAVQRTKQYVKGINNTIKYGNNDLSGCWCDNSARYYHHTGSYLERKKQRIFSLESKDTVAESIPCCEMSEDEKFYQIHGYSRTEPSSDCRC